MNPQHAVLKRRTKSRDSDSYPRGRTHMKKTLVYLLAAVILGVLVTVAPLIVIAKTGFGGNTQNAPQTRSLGQGLKQLDGGEGSNGSQVNNTDVTVLAISFIIAFLAYTLIGPKAPRRYNMRLGVPPY